MENKKLLLSEEIKKIIEDKNKTTNSKIGSVLKAYRIANELSQQAVSDKIGVNIRTYQKWEAGDQMPNAKDLFKMIKLLEIDIEHVEKAFDVEKI